ncbi:hypothetical protein [Delftia tsuruhatensis]|uniref:hypothetical protein n=1 Tax=Delftia tsuruhatensis TaxID=180282 RepID=UPI002091A867|nr:hypothetical protein [Delftia tsuruhatensis]MCO5338561.1 hypothetical protein [Delftia tsuruhatensis]MCR4546655.1 hypothetical protein [Delftia tsuruhatensis]
MGYTTRFTGALALSRALTMQEAKTLLEFNQEPDLIQGDKPNSYLQWVPSEDLSHIVWDEGEKFYDYNEWMTWLIRHLDGIGIKVNGHLYWVGEDRTDTGEIAVIDSQMTVTPNKKAAMKQKPLTLNKLGEMALEQITS